MSKSYVLEVLRADGSVFTTYQVAPGQLRNVRRAAERHVTRLGQRGMDTGGWRVERQEVVA